VLKHRKLFHIRLIWLRRGGGALRGLALGLGQDLRQAAKGRFCG
jgi:hypothetical protein